MLSAVWSNHSHAFEGWRKRLRERRAAPALSLIRVNLQYNTHEPRRVHADHRCMPRRRRTTIAPHVASCRHLRERRHSRVGATTAIFRRRPETSPSRHVLATTRLPPHDARRAHTIHEHGNAKTPRCVIGPLDTLVDRPAGGVGRNDSSALQPISSHAGASTASRLRRKIRYSSVCVAEVRLDLLRLERLRVMQREVA